MKKKSYTPWDYVAEILRATNVRIDNIRTSITPSFKSILKIPGMRLIGKYDKGKFIESPSEKRKSKRC